MDIIANKKRRVNVRRQGNNFEREVVKFFAKLLNLLPFNGKNTKDADVGRSSHFSKALDDQGIDIWFKDSQYADLLKVQCKKSKNRNIDISSIEEYPDRLLFTKLTNQVNSRESHRVTMVTMNIDMFEEIMKVYLQSLNTSKDARTVRTKRSSNDKA